MPRSSAPPGWDGTKREHSPSMSIEGPEDVSMSDGEAVASYPPPHIAARFYRTNGARRKSSAASSRRNSMTSQRSNRSNRTSHGGVQSSHVAQHLRRMSIIESRKARLADRAAHAEAVRLRAALAKAAPRTSTTSEARAAAAHAARERYLAQVAANCAEEVKRSKKIAEEMKEKKAAEHLKLKEDMQERLADAERRRALYQQSLKRSRPTSLPVVEESRVTVQARRPLNEATAVRCIQHAWRRVRGDRILQEFATLGLLEKVGKGRSFEDWTTFVAQEDTIAKTSGMLRLFQISQDEASVGSTTPRLFLSSFLILEHPIEILNGNGPLEHELQARACDLYSTFVQLYKSNAAKYSPSTITTPLSESFTRFTATFAAWKAGDASSLVNGILAQFAELDAIWQTVKDDSLGGVADDYQEGIQKTQTLLIVRLKRLLGRDETTKRIRKAVQERRKLKAPRQMDKINGLQQNLDIELPKIDKTLLNPSGDSPASTNNIYKTVHLRNLLMLMDPLPDNRAIVHELSIDRTYSLKLKPRTARWEEAMKRLFADMQADLEAGNDNPQILYIAEFIRSQLLRLVDSRKPQYNLIAETLDPKYIEDQVKNSSFSYEKFFNFMNGVLPKLCAPIRDAEIKALSKNDNDDVVERLLSLMHVVRMLSVDHVNYILQAAAPKMLSVAAKYERKQFAEKMRTCHLDKTRRWWHEAREKTKADLSRRSQTLTTSTGSVAFSTPANPPSPTAEMIYAQGLVTLFISPYPLSESQIPETLELDGLRIERVRGDILRIITISTILLTAKNLLRRDVRTPWTGIFNQLWALPAPYADSQGSTPYRSMIELSHVLPEHVKPSLDGTIRRVLAEARGVQDGDGNEGDGLQQPVMRVLLAKLRDHVLRRLSASSEAERSRMEGRIGEMLGNVGLMESLRRINGIVGEMSRVKHSDWEAHEEWISQVAKKEAEIADAENAGMRA